MTINSPKGDIKKEMDFDRREQNIFKSNKLEWKCGSLSRVYISLLLIGMAFIQYLEFGIEFNIENGEGNWLFLGGPSLFYPTALVPLIFTFLILIFSIGSWKTIVMQIEMHNNDNNLSISERNRIFPWKKSNLFIPIKDIHNIYFSNARIHAQYLWIFPFGIHIWYLGIDAIKYLTNPFVFNRGYITGFFYLIQVIIELIVVAVLILRTPIHMEMYDLHRKIIIREFVRNKNKQLFEEIAVLFKGLSTTIMKNNDSQYNRKSESFIKPKTNVKLIISGIILIILAFVSRLGTFYAGEPLQMALVFTGTLIIIRSTVEFTQIYSNYKTMADHNSSIMIWTNFNYYWTASYLEPSLRVSNRLWKKNWLRNLKPSLIECIGLGSVVCIALIQMFSVYWLVPITFSSYSLLVTINWFGLISICISILLFVNGYKTQKKNEIR